ncbi:MAG: deoxyribose-phosphate aldolase, partial [Planctomycetota bacterium]
LTLTPTLSLKGRGGLESTRVSTPLVVAAVGFPLGASLTATKADEARRAIDDGATEIDMVVALGELIGGDRAYVRSDIEAVARVVHQATGNRLLKVILETAALTTDQLILGCRCCAEAEADFVKTSTGLHPRGGATAEHVRQLHRHASPLRVKAAGGIRTAEAAKAMLEAGAVRIGTSAGVAILEQLRAFRLRRT